MDDTSDSTSQEKHALGRRLKGLRESISWTLGELSQATKQMDPDKEGVSKVSISRYENGDSFPGYREIRLLAQAFGVSITFLFYGDAPDPYAGWEFSLDEYLRSVILDVLIDEGVIEGESRAQKENKKMRALRALQSRRAPIEVSELDPEDKIQHEELKKREWEKLGKLAEEVDKGLSKRPLKTGKKQN
ncbi:MAG: helix-turn-helix transcriptional regulator [Burkholderiaceae bacterium]|nr:helix-turn-helix transcriptional regulator [Burkholderiaceae bacterium]